MSNAGSAKNVLTSEVEIKGNLKFTGELTFEGKLDGEINSDGTLHLGDSAIINGNINAGTVIVRGKINGNITAKDKITIEEGVTFVGKTEVNPNKVAPSAPARNAATTSSAPPLTTDVTRSTEPAKAGKY